MILWCRHRVRILRRGLLRELLQELPKVLPKELLKEQLLELHQSILQVKEATSSRTMSELPLRAN